MTWPRRPVWGISGDHLRVAARARAGQQDLAHACGSGAGRLEMGKGAVWVKNALLFEGGEGLVTHGDSYSGNVGSGGATC
jgi:hypothetical protein